MHNCKRRSAQVQIQAGATRVAGRALACAQDRGVKGGDDGATGDYRVEVRPWQDVSQSRQVHLSQQGDEQNSDGAIVYGAEPGEADNLWVVGRTMCVEQPADMEAKIAVETAMPTVLSGSTGPRLSSMAGRPFEKRGQGRGHLRVVY